MNKASWLDGGLDAILLIYIIFIIYIDKDKLDWYTPI